MAGAGLPFEIIHRTDLELYMEELGLLGSDTLYGNDIQEAGRQALMAAEMEDEAAVFDAGAEVYYVCSACHVQYALETLNPSDIPSDSGGT